MVCLTLEQVISAAFYRLFPNDSPHPLYSETVRHHEETCEDCRLLIGILVRFHQTDSVSFFNREELGTFWENRYTYLDIVRRKKHATTEEGQGAG